MAPPTEELDVRGRQLAELRRAGNAVAGGLEVAERSPVDQADAVRNAAGKATTPELALLLGLIIAQLEQLAGLALATHARAGAIIALWENGRDEELVANVKQLHTEAGVLATAVEDLDAQLAEVMR